MSGWSANATASAASAGVSYATDSETSDGPAVEVSGGDGGPLESSSDGLAAHARDDAHQKCDG